MVLTVVDATSIEDVSNICDRRRSRAARELLRNHLIRTWEETNRIVSSLTDQKTVTSSKDDNNNNNNNKYNIDVNEWNVWQLLDATIIQTNDNDNNHRQINDVARLPICPLLPQYDLFKEHEESYSIFDMTSAIIPQRYRNSAIPGILHHKRSTGQKHFGSSSSQSKSPKRHHQQELYPLMYHCDVCQKNFISQYYLDQHLINQHPLTSNNNSITSAVSSSSDQICPADLYCSFLSPIVCDDSMIRQEPYYGPGHFIALLDDITTTANTQYTTSNRICNDQEQQRAIQKCHEIIALCFDESIRSNDGSTTTTSSSSSHTFGQILSTSMCATIPNCQTRYVDNVMTTISLSAKNIFPRSYIYIHHPYSILDHYTTSTWMALLMVTFIFILVFGHYIYQLVLAILQKQQSEQQHRRYTEETNIHPPHTSARIIVPPPTTYIVPTKTKLT